MKVTILDKLGNAKIIHQRNHYLKASDEKILIWKNKLLKTTIAKCKSEPSIFDAQKTIWLATSKNGTNNEQKERLVDFERDLSSQIVFMFERVPELKDPNSKISQELAIVEEQAVVDRYDVKALAIAIGTFAYVGLSKGFAFVIDLLPTTQFVRGHVDDVIEAFSAGVVFNVFMKALHGPETDGEKKAVNALAVFAPVFVASVAEFGQYLENTYQHTFHLGRFDPWDFLSYAIGGALAFGINYLTEKKREKSNKMKSDRASDTSAP